MQHFLVITFAATMLLFSSCKSDNSGNEQAQTPAAATIDTLTGEPIRQPNPWKETACDLLTDEEFEAIFHVETKRDFANKRSLPGYCLRNWKKPDWREREIVQDKNPDIATSPESMLAIEVLDFGTETTSSAQFEMNKRDRINGYNTEIPELGEGALWSEREMMILVKKGHLCLQIKLDHTDNAADNLPFLKEVVTAALKKM